jgi:hypothetical protein
MKKTITLFTATLLALCITTVMAQPSYKELKAGHEFYISIPDYMNKTTGLNSSATVQFKSEVKDVYGFIIEDNKEEMALAEINFSSINEFYTDFITDFIKGEKKRTVSTPISKTVGTTHFMECDFSYYDKDAKTEIYYLIGIVETPTSFYKVLCWSTLENKEKFKADFQKITYSLKD